MDNLQKSIQVCHLIPNCANKCLPKKSIWKQYTMCLRKKGKNKKICNEFDYQKEPVQEINCSRRLEKPELMRPSI